MEIGFEVVAAKPKGLRAVEDQPVQQPMRGDRKITQAPSTDQKKIRRAQQRKTAVKTICRSCHKSMLTTEDDKFPLCSDCDGTALGRHLMEDHMVPPFGGKISPDYSDHNNRELHDHEHRQGRGGHTHEASKTAHQGDDDYKHVHTTDIYPHAICGDCGSQVLQTGDGWVDRDGSQVCFGKDNGMGHTPIPQSKVTPNAYANEVKYPKQATQVNVRADRLNPGDYVRTPTGQVVKVQQVRNHQTSGDHVWVDTEGGSALVRRSDQFTYVPYNAVQQELPGYGTPGGNANNVPGSQKNPWGGEEGGSNAAPKGAKCPICGTALARQGDHYVCPRDGFTESVNNVGGLPGGSVFTDQPNFISNPKPNPRRASKTAGQGEPCPRCGSEDTQVVNTNNWLTVRCDDCGYDGTVSVTDRKHATKAYNGNLSHRLREDVPLDVHYPTTGSNAGMAVLHAGGCSHRGKGAQYGHPISESAISPAEAKAFNDGTPHYADDYFEVAPCARAKGATAAKTADQQCYYCEGSGTAEDGEKCDICHGTGTATSGPQGKAAGRVVCPKCDGKKCQRCDHQGTIDEDQLRNDEYTGDNLADFERIYLGRTSAMNDMRGSECRLCGGDLLHRGEQDGQIKAVCRDCGTEHQVQKMHAPGRTAARIEWVPVPATTDPKYLTHQSAIARRAQAVLDTPEEML